MAGERPEGVPEFVAEKFWATDNPLEAQAKAYAEAQSMIGRQREAVAEELRPKLREQVQAEINEQLGIPDKPDGYKLPDDWNGENPVAKDILGKLHEAGYGQKQLDAMFEVYRSMAPDFEAEKNALGEEADSRIEAARNFVNETLDEALAKDALSLTMTANGVQIIETLMQKVGSSMPDGGQNGATQNEGPMTISRLAEMQNDPRYSDPSKRDPAYVAQVEKAAEQIDYDSKIG